MDLVAGLTAAKLAFDLAKDLRDIDKSVDEAAFKLKLAELTTALADAQVVLAGARTEQLEMEARIQNLEGELDEAKNGEICPRCRVGRLMLVEARPEPRLGLKDFGVETWRLQCSQDECEFVQTKKHDPHGVLPKIAAKR
ncbi:hypothetical protein GTA62_03720 [Roseobacter sp. HKCCD9010]|uniref:hypothetical protein n=1 Tax=unclassified Roseobacter TaxID=196798 RepID=UPI001492A716|nr:MULTISPECIES: hypothetical protein [unclassified Roseobacter]MBF9049024.1 hypothetical protein [Rhodobacterales bacterium HKCCD4356]NNV11024.1 hypothetical protein [Roseobacter sp. HKCCD7357]NNV15208.1 hypothetical protein [Roseobacter sp. HKCCD8768]NNV24668.1 hypothetical protein [Roseobacter sp. HKCCD8192]NNV28924.1 hypothetical protein [Roseobacter sp. HKCCD9061]